MHATLYSYSKCRDSEQETETPILDGDQLQHLLTNVLAQNEHIIELNANIVRGLLDTSNLRHRSAATTGG